MKKISLKEQAREMEAYKQILALGSAEDIEEIEKLIIGYQKLIEMLHDKLPGETSGE